MLILFAIVTNDGNIKYIKKNLNVNSNEVFHCSIRIGIFELLGRDTRL